MAPVVESGDFLPKLLGGSEQYWKLGDSFRGDHKLAMVGVKSADLEPEYGHAAPSGFLADGGGGAGAPIVETDLEQPNCQVDCYGGHPVSGVNGHYHLQYRGGNRLYAFTGQPLV